MKRGISPIIATILLIIMTIGIAALMYTWLTGMLNQLTTQSSQQIVQQTAFNFKVTPLSASNNTTSFTVAITNTGSITINTSNMGGVLTYVTVYSKINPGTPEGTYNCSANNITSLQPGQVTQLTVNCSGTGLSDIDLTQYYYDVRIVIGSIAQDVVFS